MTLFNCGYEEALVSRAKGAIYGLALGEALKTKTDLPIVNEAELVNPNTFFNPTTGLYLDLVLAVNLSDSLLAHGGVHIQDQLIRYSQWRRKNIGISTLQHFKIGENLNRALNRYEQSQLMDSKTYKTFPDFDACLTRISPLSVFYSPMKGVALESVMEQVKSSCQVTHRSNQAVIACQILAAFIHKVLSDPKHTKQELFSGLGSAELKLTWSNEWKDIQPIISGEFLAKERHHLTNKTVLGSLEAALWCFYHSNSFEQGSLLAANIEGNHSNIATVHGQLAGAYYGFDQLPKAWMDILSYKDSIEHISNLLISTPVAKNLSNMHAQYDEIISEDIKEIVPKVHHEFYQQNMILKYDYQSDVDYMLKGEVEDHLARLPHYNYTQLLQYLTVIVRNDRFCSGLLQHLDRSGVIKSWWRCISKYIVASPSQSMLLSFDFHPLVVNKAEFIAMLDTLLSSETYDITMCHRLQSRTKEMRDYLIENNHVQADLLSREQIEYLSAHLNQI